MTSRFSAFSSRSLRLQIALAVTAVAAIAVVHVALQTGFVSFGSGASAERVRAEPQSRESDHLVNAPGSVSVEPVQRDLIKRGAAASL